MELLTPLDAQVDSQAQVVGETRLPCSEKLAYLPNELNQLSPRSAFSYGDALRFSKNLRESFSAYLPTEPLLLEHPETFLLSFPGWRCQTLL